jgi:ABC-2 type transport system ATP-binding protein
MDERQAFPLHIEGLVKRYGRLEVLRGLDLSLPAGGVYGLVGLNGSGKTTTIECALGLNRFTTGRISILGGPPERIFRTRGRVGVVFDTPCLHPTLTVRQTLLHARLVTGPRSRPPEELERLLGIEAYRSVRIRTLSLGNRRRAALAHALVGRPSLVIFDEPFNGLDAGGVDDLVAIIGDLAAREGTTFFLASHQLAYLERICTHMGILSGGVIARGGTVGELLAGRKDLLRVRVDDPERARAVLAACQGVRLVAGASEGRLHVELDGMTPGAVNRTLIRAGLEVSELAAEPPTLAAIFRETVGRSR